MGSAGAWFAGYLKKDERNANTSQRERLLDMLAAARRRDSTEELDRMQAEADDILRHTLHCFEHGAIEEGALTAFNIALEQFHNAVADRKALLMSMPQNLQRAGAAVPGRRHAVRIACCNRAVIDSSYSVFERRVPVRVKNHRCRSVSHSSDRNEALHDRSVLASQTFPPTFSFHRAATGAGVIAMPYLSRAADRPLITHGVQSGDVGADGGVVWARADRPSQMMVEVATTESFANARALPPIAALPESDFTAKMLLENLPAGQDIFYRVRFRDLVAYRHRRASRWPAASAPRRPTGATSVSSGAATSPDRAGASIPTMAACSPSPPCASTGRISCCIPATPSMPMASSPSEVKLADGKIWKNVTIPEKAKVAETLDEFRAAHKYNFLDDNVRAFNAEVPIFVQWDDHEVTNNWSPSKQLPAAYKERDITLLAARAGARVPRDVSDARKHRRAGPGLPHAQLRPASRRVHAGRAQLSRPQRSEPADQLMAPTAISSGRTSSPG